MHIAPLSVITAAMVAALATSQTPPSWQIADTPIASVGANDEFASIVSGAFLDGGAFVIGDVMNARISVFTPEGRLERTIGRKGAGPGEFGNMAWARPYHGDSIASYDLAQRRVTVFSRSGAPLRSVIVTSPPNGWAPEALALLRDGRILVQTTRMIGAEAAPPGIHAADMEIWVYSPEGTPLNRIAGNLVSMQWVKLATPNLLMPRPFGLNSLIATHDSSIFIADSADAPIRELSVSGSEVRRYASRSASRISSAAHIASYRDEQLASARQSNNATSLATRTRMLDATPFPEFMPALRRIFVDKDRRLWVQEYPEPRARRQRFRVYGPDGRLVANVTGPDRGRVLDVRGTHALFAWSDDDGVPYVRVSAIQAR